MINKEQFGWVALVVLALSGCSTTPSQKQIGYVEHAREIAPTCSTDQECAAIMGAAKRWIDEKAFAPFTVDTPTELRTFERGSYWGVTMTAIVELEPISETTKRMDARFGMYTPGEAPIYDPKFYKLVVEMYEAISSD